MNAENNCCGQLISFFLDEMAAEERAAFEEHLSGCSACREELEQLLQAWNAIPYTMEMLEPPPGLKGEVLGAVLGESGTKPPASAEQQDTPEKRLEAAEQGDQPEKLVPAVKHEQALEPSDAEAQYKPAAKRTEAALDRSKRRSPRFAAVAVLLVLILGYAGWMQFSQLQRETPQTQPDLHLPAQLVGEYALKPFDPSLPAARGQAWLMKKGGSMQLVLQTSGLPVLQGEQAYQVWLVKEGNRVNGGTFRVDAQGNGVLTYKIGESDRPFDTIGITLEPDSTGTKPRGKKVLGT